MKKIIAGYFRTMLTLISPKLNTRVTYFFKFKKFIKLKNPVTLDEKIQWLKFNTYYKNSLVRDCVDKYKVRDYVAQCGCPEILNELYFAWDSVDEINWEKLPNKFVIKWNFGCGQNLIVRDKSKLDIESTKALLRKWHDESRYFYLQYAEMQYKGIKPKLICEKLIETANNTLPIDYKIYCFNGKAKYVMLCVDRENGHPKYYFFDKNMKFCKFDYPSLELPDDFSIEKPLGFEKLFYYAEKLTSQFPFVRADFYLENGQVLFGELTFTPCGGMDSTILPEKNEYLGSLVEL